MITWVHAAAARVEEWIRKNLGYCEEWSSNGEIEREILAAVARDELGKVLIDRSPEPAHALPSIHDPELPSHAAPAPPGDPLKAPAANPLPDLFRALKWGRPAAEQKFLLRLADELAKRGLGGGFRIEDILGDMDGDPADWWKR